MDIKQPEVTLLSWTGRPLETVYAVWEASKTEEPLRTPEEVQSDVPQEEIEELFRAIIAQRIPIGEHIDFVFMLENVSISFREQAVRHRIGVKPSLERVGVDIVMSELPNLADSSWWSQSMRIQLMNTFARDGRYRMAETIAEHPDPMVKHIYQEVMKAIELGYTTLVEKGVPMEDARDLIPLGAHHRISWKLNFSALQHIIGKRSCVTGDTMVPLLDGRTRTMKELLDEYGTQEYFWIYSCDEDGRVVPGHARHNGITKKKAKLVEVELDNGRTIRVTPDHLFMLRDGSWLEAGKLTAGMSLMPLYRKVSDGKSSNPADRIKGYEMVYHPKPDEWEFTHRLVAKDLERNDGETIVHHRNFNKRDNDPGNLEWKEYKSHIRLHSCKKGIPCSQETKDKLRAVSREKRVKAGKIAAAKGVLKANGIKSVEKTRGNKERGQRISASLKITLATPEQRKKKSIAAKRQWANPAMKRKMIDGIKRQKRRIDDGLNHKVVAVRMLDVCEDVYDLSVDAHHNYATDAGVFVHNCWILQLGLWGPVIMGMVQQLVEKVHPIFSDLATPPCVKGDEFVGCAFMEECRRRLDGEDQLPPCSLHFNYYHPGVAGKGITGLLLPKIDIPMRKEMMQRMEQYAKFWHRDPFTGERLTRNK